MQPGLHSRDLCALCQDDGVRTVSVGGLLNRVCGRCMQLMPSRLDNLRQERGLGREGRTRPRVLQRAGLLAWNVCRFTLSLQVEVFWCLPLNLFLQR